MPDTQMMVVRADEQLKKVDVGGKALKFGRSNAFTTTDTRLASDIQQAYGDRVVVVPVTRDLRQRTWSFPEMPWKREKK